MDDTFAGWQTYLIIMKHLGDGQNMVCPWNKVSFDTSDNLVQMNAIWYVNSGFDAPYTSFDLLAAAAPFDDLAIMVFDQNTGEGRYYDGTQAGDPDVFWPLEKCGIGKVQKPEPNLERPVEFIKAIGETWPVDAKEMQYEATLSFDKVWIPKRKFTPDIDQPAVNQYGFEGSGLLLPGNLDDLIAKNPKRLEWFLAVLYTLDATNDTTFHAQTIIYPCIKFESLRITGDATSAIMCSIAGKPLNMIKLPTDIDNIEGYYS